MKYFTLLFLITLCISCSDADKKNAQNLVYFGGEIINPNDKYVLLYHQDKLIDSIELDDNNRFMTTLKNHKDGLYKFYHTPEHQYINLEKGDSLLLRLNTLEFDETLFYTGKGAEKNNYYIDLYLMNERLERPIFRYTKLESDSFLFKIDSLRRLKLDKQANFLAENSDISENFKSFSNDVIRYTDYKYRETYKDIHNRTHVDSTYHEVDPKVIAYRDDVNLNDTILSYFVPYVRYTTRYINNMAYRECMKKNLERDQKINTSLSYNRNKLALIDSLVTYPYLRDQLLRSTAYSFFRDNHTDVQKNVDFFRMFQKISRDKKTNEEIESLHAGIQNLQIGNTFPDDVIVYTTDYAEVPVKQLNSKSGKTVFYFWTSAQQRHKNLMNAKIKKLSEEFPDVNFVGISLDKNQKRWKKAIAESNLASNQQYRANQNSTVLHDFALIGINKLIIVDQSGRIENAFANIYHRNLKEQLKK